MGEEKTLENMTVKSVYLDGVTYTPSWETDGLKLPLVVYDEYNKKQKCAYLRIPREVVKEMVKDILEELSHT